MLAPVLALAVVGSGYADETKPEPPTLTITPAVHGLMEPGQQGLLTLALRWPALTERISRDVAGIAAVASGREMAARQRAAQAIQPVRIPDQFSSYVRFRPTKPSPITVPDLAMRINGRLAWAPGSELPVMSAGGKEQTWQFGVMPARVRQGSHARLIAARRVPEPDKHKRAELVKKLRGEKLDAKAPGGLQFYGGGTMVRESGKSVVVQHIWTVRAVKTGTFEVGGKTFRKLPDGVEAPPLKLVIDPAKGNPKGAPAFGEDGEPVGEPPTLEVMLVRGIPVVGDNCFVAVRLRVPRIEQAVDQALPRADWHPVGGHASGVSDGRGMWMQFAFRPQYPGLAQLGPYEVEIDGHLVRSEPVLLRVLEAWPLAGDGEVRVYVERDQVRVGETTHLWVVRRAAIERGGKRPTDAVLRKIKLKADPRFDVGKPTYATWHESGREQRQVARFPIRVKTPDLIELTAESFEHLPKGVEVRDVMIDVLPGPVADAGSPGD